MNASPLLELIRVQKTYGDQEQDGVGILNGVDLTLRAGESLAIVGPSGSGKTTLLNIIGGLESPTAGRVLLEGQEWRGLSPDERARVRNRRLGFVFQHHYLLPQCTVLENVVIPALIHPDADEAMTRARSLLNRVGLHTCLHRFPGELSGGECQRVAVVRALINRPALVLADEPTGSLDLRAARAVADLLVELNRALGVTLIVATHAHVLAARMQRVLMLSDGVLREPRPSEEG